MSIKKVITTMGNGLMAFSSAVVTTAVAVDIGLTANQMRQKYNARITTREKVPGHFFKQTVTRNGFGQIVGEKGGAKI